MTIDSFGKKTWGTKSEESWHKFIDAGFLKSNGEVKAKYLANGTFDEDGNILDLKAVREFFANLEEEDDDEEDEKPAPKAVAKNPAKDAEEDSGIEVDIDTLFTVLNDFKFESREQIGELMDVLVDKMVHFDSPAKAVKSEPVEEDESDDEPDPNREGKYRGWTITIDGRKVVATKRGKSLTCSVKSGNIRELINEEEG